MLGQGYFARSYFGRGYFSARPAALPLEIAGPRVVQAKAETRVAVQVLIARISAGGAERRYLETEFSRRSQAGLAENMVLAQKLENRLALASSERRVAVVEKVVD